MKFSKLQTALFTAVSLLLAACSAGSGSSDGNDAATTTRAAWDGFVAPQPSFPKKSVDANVEIPMDDGIVLRADVYYPALEDGSRAPGRFPVIVVDTCYGKSAHSVSGATGGSTVFPFYGYVQVVFDARGTGASDGEFGMVDAREQKDGYAVIEWAARQPFSDGRVGVGGFSYMGVTSTMIAATQPPSLKAAISGGAPLDIYRTFAAQGGHWASSSLLWFILELMGVAPGPLVLDPPSLIPRDPTTDLLVLLTRLQQNGSSLPFRAEQGASLITEENNWDNAFWQERAVDARKIRVPTLVYTGWQDLFLRDGPREYRDLQLPPGQKQLVVGPWTHYTNPKPVGADGISNTDELMVAWFDRWVKGIPNGIETLGPVTLYEHGSERWLRHGDWPLPGTRYQRLYLTGEKSGSAISLNDGTLSGALPAAAGSDQGVLNLLDGLCARSALQYLGGAPGIVPVANQLPCWTDQRLQEANALTYTTAPVEEDTLIAGPIALTLRASSSAEDPTLVALISDVGPDGASIAMTEGALRASRRALDPSRSYYSDAGDPSEPFHWHTPETASAVPPGEVAVYNIEIWPVNWMLRTGHRLRLTVTAADFPHLLPSLSTPGRLGLQTVHYSTAEPSVLIVPLQEPLMLQ